MIKDYNLGSKKNLIKSIISAEPVVYGAAPTNAADPTSTDMVKFAFHAGSTVAATGANGEVVFNALETSTGVITIGDRIVSSKILDIYADLRNDASDGVKTVTVKYVDSDFAIQTANFEVVDEAAVKGWIATHTAIADASIDRLDTSVNAIEAYEATDNLKEVTTNNVGTGAITVTPTQGAVGYTHTLGVNVDGKTIKINNSDKLETNIEFAYVNAAADKPAHLEFRTMGTDASVISSVSVSDIIGNGVVKSSSYDDTTNILTIYFENGTADSSTPVTIDMQKLIDINDVTVDDDSLTYISYTADSSTAKIALDVVTSDASLKADSLVVGSLIDAKIMRDYVDEKSTDLAVSASGDSYVDASVDSSNNKHVNVAAQTADVTASAGTRGTWSVSDAGVATLSDTEVAPSLSGTSGKLLDAANAMSGVKTYTDAKVAIEAAERAAKIEAAVKALDKTTTTAISNEHLTIKYSETDGIVTVDASTDDIASAALLGSKDDASTAETAFGYIAKQAAIAKANLDSSIAGLDADVTSDDATVATVEVKEENGVISDVIVTTISAGVNRDGDASGARVLNASVLTGAVTGADIADIKGYVDDRFTDFQGASDSSVTVKDASSFITTKINFVDGALTATDSSLSYVHAVYAPESNSITTNGLADGQFVLDLVNDRINDLDETVVADDESYVSVTVIQENGKLKDSSIAVTYATYDPNTDAVSDGIAKGSFVKTVATDLISELDSSVKSDTTNVNIEIVETDGKLTGLTVSEDYVIKTVTDSSLSTDNLTILTEANLTFDDNNKLVKGSDVISAVSVAKDYTNSHLKAALTWTIL